MTNTSGSREESAAAHGVATSRYVIVGAGPAGVIAVPPRVAVG
jgi:hypothetical protein